MKANTTAAVGEEKKNDSSEEEDRDPQTIPGYFKDKFKRNLGNINHFI